MEVEVALLGEACCWDVNGVVLEVGRPAVVLGEVPKLREEVGVAVGEDEEESVEVVLGEAPTVREEVGVAVGEDKEESVEVVLG